MTAEPPGVIHALQSPALRGAAFMTTLWILIAITATVLVTARSIRVEAIASANRLSQAQADAAERGVEQFLRCVVDAEVTTPGSTAKVSMEARRLGDCWFWILKPDPADEQNRAYGLTDEGGKIDLNTASYYMISMLPNLSPDVASSILNWRGVASYGYGVGAADADYQALPIPYACKHAPFETTEELLLVKNVDDALLFGVDRNRDGWVNPRELTDGAPAMAITTDNASARGIFPYVTAYGSLATNVTLASSSQRPVDVNVTVAETPNGPVYNDSALRRALQSAGVSDVATVIRRAELAQSQIGSYQTPLQWAAYADLPSSDFSKVYATLRATPSSSGGVGSPATPPAKINVNTAPKQVLMCLPGLQASDADAIIAHRKLDPSADPRDISWLLDALPHEDLRPAAAYLTNYSTVFSADIVAVAPDGRAFSRYRIVIDGSKTPAFILYRHSLHCFGWPLTQDIRNALRHAQPPPDENAPLTP